ncbi:hypothetical protein RJ639_011887 [Escallonia herrerae]|uniref:CCHC-type domain-containing protein n=1 Tax=Escallonia herrerae TaxID=1293975 RepID=A0AA88VN95_9ASTE|nr:hypothetical protein RJ639_011887 [Escallonia herrerae]
MALNTLTKYDLEKFNGSNDFSLWRKKMHAVLIQQGLLKALKGKQGLPDTMYSDVKEDMLERAHSVLLLCLANNVLRKVSQKTTAAGLWLKLESLYMMKSLTNCMYLKQRLYTLRMKESPSISDHLDEYNKVILDLKNVDIKIKDEDKGFLLMCSLPPSYEHLVTTLLYGKDSIFMEEVDDVINSQELRKKVSKNKREEHDDGLMARGLSTDHVGSKNKGRLRSQSKARKLKCYHCHKKGHYRKDCPEHGGPILDTGYSYHMSPNRDWFATYLSFDGGKVLMGNDVTCKVIEIGSIHIRLQYGIVRTLSDVRHVPELRKNLISLGALDSNGCSYQAAGVVMRIMKGALVVMKGLKQNSLYLLQGSPVTGAAATTSSSDIDSDTTKL